MALHIVIDVTDEGQLQIQGPLQDKIQMLGLLELAKKAVLDFRGEERRIVPAASIPFPKNGA